MSDEQRRKELGSFVSAYGNARRTGEPAPTVQAEGDEAPRPPLEDMTEEQYQEARLDSAIAQVKGDMARASGDIPDEDTPSAPMRALGALQSAGGTALSGLGTALEAPLKYIAKPVAGVAARQLAEDGFFDDEIAEAILEAEGSGVGGARSAFEAYQDASGHGTVRRFATDVAMDPLNLVGGGLVGLAGKSLRAQGVLKAGSMADKTISQVNQMDRLAGRALSLPITGPVWAVRRAFRPIDNWYFSRNGKRLFDVSDRFNVIKRVGRAVGLMNDVPQLEQILGLNVGRGTLRQASREQADRFWESIAPQMAEGDMTLFNKMNQSMNDQQFTATYLELFDKNTARYMRDDPQAFQAIQRPWIEAGHERGLLKPDVRDPTNQSFVLTDRALAHSDMDDVLWTIGHNVAERQALSLGLDAAAKAIANSHRANLERMTAQGVARNEATEGAWRMSEILQTEEGVYRKMSFRHHADPEQPPVYAEYHKPRTGKKKKDLIASDDAEVVTYHIRDDATPQDVLRTVFGETTHRWMSDNDWRILAQSITPHVADEFHALKSGPGVMARAPQDEISDALVQLFRTQRPWDSRVQGVFDVVESTLRRYDMARPVTDVRQLRRVGELINRRLTGDWYSPDELRARMLRGRQVTPATTGDATRILDADIRRSHGIPQIPREIIGDMPPTDAVPGRGTLDEVSFNQFEGPPQPFTDEATVRFPDMPPEVEVGFTPRVVSRPTHARSTTQTGMDASETLHRDASLDDVLDLIRRESSTPISREQMQPVRDYIDQIVGQNYAYAHTMYLDPQANLFLKRAMREPQNMQQHVQEAARAIRDESFVTGATHPMWYKVFKGFDEVFQIAPPPGEVRPTRAAGRGTLQYTSRHTEVMQDMWRDPETRNRLIQMETETRELDNLIRMAKSQDPSLSLDPDDMTMTFGQVVKALPRMREAQQKRVKELLDNWGIPTEQRLVGFGRRHQSPRKGTRDFHVMQQQRLILDSYERALKKEFGIKATKQSRWMKEFLKATGAWREQALMSVRYHVTNALDMIVKSLVYGVNPLKYRSAQTMAERWGMDMPESIRQSYLRERDLIGAEFQLDQNTNIMLARYFGGHAYTRRVLKPDAPKRPGVALEDRPLNEVDFVEVPGTRAGEAVASAVRFNRTAALWLETSARSAAWVTGTAKHMDEVIRPNFLGQSERLARQHGHRQTRALRDELDMAFLESNSDEIYHTVFKHTNNQQLATDVSNLWRRGLGEASEMGEDLALRVHFDFVDERVIETMAGGIRNILPFHVWATRNIPFYLNTMAHNPWIYRTMFHYHNAVEEQNEHMNLSARFRERMMVPDKLNPVLGIFLGPGTHFYNPTILFSIADQTKQPYIPPDPDGAMEQLGHVTLRQAQRLGFRPAPWIDIPLHAFGVYGNQEPFGITRHGDLLASGLYRSTGVDIDYRPVQRGTAAVRSVFPWNEHTETISGSSFYDRQINMKLHELALENTGDVNHPDYMAAMVDPDSELYRRARREVDGQRFAEGMQAFLHPLPHARLPDWERDRNALAPRGERHPAVTQHLYDVDSPVTDFWGIPSTRPRAEISAGFAQTRGATSTEERQAALQGQDLEWFWRYLQWRGTRPEGSDRSIRAFLAEHNTQY